MFLPLQGADAHLSTCPTCLFPSSSFLALALSAWLSGLPLPSGRRLRGDLHPLRPLPCVHGPVSASFSVPASHPAPGLSVATQRASSWTVGARAPQRALTICSRYLVPGQLFQRLLSLCAHRSPTGLATKEFGIKRTWGSFKKRLPFIRLKWQSGAWGPRLAAHRHPAPVSEGAQPRHCPLCMAQAHGAAREGARGAGEPDAGSRIHRPFLAEGLVDPA